MKKLRIYFFLFAAMTFTANISFGQWQFSTGNMGKFIRVGNNFQYLPFANLHYTINCDSIKLPNSKTITANSVVLNSESNYFVHYVGELYSGGIVVAIWKSSGVEHGLIMALTDQSTSLAWSSNTTGSTGGTSLYDGAANTTTNISGANADVSKANYMCDTLTMGGYTDWYLPASYEMDLAVNEGAIIGYIIGANGLNIGGYWTSSEASATQAYYKNNYLGTIIAGAKSALLKVRAFRKY